MPKKKKPQLPKKRSVEAYAMILRKGAGAGHHGDKAKYSRKQKHKSRENPNKVYYHGTPNLESAKAIDASGYLRGRAAQGRAMLAPVAGRVYLAPDVAYAQIYALGGNMAGSTFPEGHTARDPYGYVFVVREEDLPEDIQPDEDQVGELCADKDYIRAQYGECPSWLRSLFQRHATPGQKSKVLWGDYAAYAQVGKKLLKHMTREQKDELIARGMAVAALGQPRVSECWRIDKRRSAELRKDGSNFFQIAERCPPFDRARDNAGLSKREKMMVEAGVIPAPPEGYVKPGTFGPFVPMVGKFKYKKKVGASSSFSGEYIDVALYDGTKRVGLIQLTYVGKRSRLHELCAPLVEALNPSQNEFGELRAWYVAWSEVDESRRSEGLGRLLYDAAIDAMYRTPCGYRNPPGPFLFLPGDCVSPYTTSSLALRVWPSLARDYAHQRVVRGKLIGAFAGQPWENYVLRIDQPPVFRLPKASRKVESAAANPRRARRNPDTQAFWDWFGDSQMLDDDLNPIVLYHGTNKEFTTFRPQSRSVNTLSFGVQMDTERTGIFLSDNPEFSKQYGQHVMPLYARIENPAKLTRNLILDFAETLDPFGKERELWSAAKHAKPSWEVFDGELGKRFVAFLREQGYDSATFTEDLETENGNWVEGQTFVVFDPHQIKSATGNRGTWDANDPDIRRNPRTAQRNPRRARPNRSNWRGATKVQTLLFDKALFTPPQARRWAQKHNFAVPGIDQGSDASQYHRVRQHDPDLFRKATMRTIEFTDGVKAVIGVPIGAPPKQR